MSITSELDVYLLPAIRAQIEQCYYAQVNAQSQLDQLGATLILVELERHISFYSDHGVVHVRDVAQQMLRVLDRINGLLIPATAGPAGLDEGVRRHPGLSA